MSFVALACMLIAVDGDTLRCGEERIRLLGIDAPELPGHCVEGRHCAPGDPFASRAALAAAIKGMAMIERQGRDHYDRTLARIRVNGVDLSCSQIKEGHAVYRPDWDQYALVGTACGLSKLGGQAPAASGGRRAPSQLDRRSGANWSYRSCAEARRAGAAPLRRGTPGYGSHMDGDGDGIACEPVRR